MKRKIPFLGVMLALAMIFSYVESLIPFFYGIPGMKLGLANSIVIILLYLFSWKEALTLNLLRIVLSNLLFGNAFAIIYSLAGGLLSFLVMYLFHRFTKFSPIAISTVGGIFHNLGQIIVAVLILNNAYLFYYFTILMISGFICGLLMGVVSGSLIPRLTFLKSENYNKS